MNGGPLPREARLAAIRAALERALSPLELQVVDDSARHAGHAGARDGRGHFNVDVVSAVFEGMAPLARHRAVYAALGSLMETDIHALSINARAPAERGHGRAD
ncbi:BolA family protein [Marilutibacter aestuarii]|uniref:BolA family transcriptional regulator n=1 Tax=Marilutibacter aestuarii TaxID=1706195 RepID=A0A507ZTQ9_9GAMM|nr:BolA family protein [Lysobacter aestuarii]TQD41040.1 BolA family transcriptional regulator [Lysobacter aestuarii]